MTDSKDLFRRRTSAVLLLSAAVAAVATALAPPALAQGGAGDLTVTPTRVVFEGRDRTADLTLVNRGTETGTFRISFVRLRMDANGQFEEIDTPRENERFSEDLIRYSPRQVVLAPGASQTVRLMLRKPAELAPGEYRSHLALHATPPDDAGESIEDDGLGEKEIGIRLIPVYRITVPVIVRHGELGARAAIEDPAFHPAGDDTPPAIDFRLLREGERSLFGDLAVTFVPEDGGAPVVVGEVQGLAVYTPNDERRIRLPLAVPDGASLGAGRFEIAFEEPAEDGGAGLSAHAVLAMPTAATSDPAP